MDIRWAIALLVCGCTELPLHDLAPCEETVDPGPSWPTTPAAVEGTWTVQLAGVEDPLPLVVGAADWADDAWHRWGASSGDCAGASWSPPSRAVAVELTLSSTRFDTMDMTIQEVGVPWWRATLFSTVVDDASSALPGLLVALAPETVGEDGRVTSRRLTFEGRLGADEAVVDGQVTVEGSNGRATFRPTGIAMRVPD